MLFLNETEIPVPCYRCGGAGLPGYAIDPAEAPGEPPFACVSCATPVESAGPEASGRDYVEWLMGTVAEAMAAYDRSIAGSLMVMAGTVPPCGGGSVVDFASAAKARAAVVRARHAVSELMELEGDLSGTLELIGDRTPAPRRPIRGTVIRLACHRRGRDAQRVPGDD